MTTNDVPENMPIHGFTSLTRRDAKRIVRAAEVIFVVPQEGTEGHTAIIHGSTVLREIAESGEPRRVRMVGFRLNIETEQLESLLALVGVVHGSYEWNGGTSPVGDGPEGGGGPRQAALFGDRRKLAIGSWGMGSKGRGDG